MRPLELRRAGLQIDGRWLVRDVSLEIEPASVTAIVGPNGSGKSTLLRLLGGLWSPTEGSAQLGGSQLRKLPRQALARRVAFVPQDTQIGFGFTVRDVVAMGRHPHIGRFASPGTADTAAVQAALERADAAQLADRLVHELSGGERQRVLIARSLATEADAILLDEPTSSLDIDHSLDVLALLRELACGGKAVAVALHDLNAVARWADRVALMRGGRLQACGAVSDVLEDSLVESVFGARVERMHAADGRAAMLFHRRNGRRETGRIDQGECALEA